MDLIAWIIVVIFYLTCVMPLIGDAISGRMTDYVEALKIGAIIHAVLISFAFILFSVVWAWIRLTT
jgi:hypothetical protein